MRGLKVKKVREFKVNDYITLKLEMSRTVIYVKGVEFLICKALFILVPKDCDINIDSIDAAADKLDTFPSSDINRDIYMDISSEEEFWGHSSNLQAWAEHDYDCKIIRSNVAFPLLRRLVEAGDPLAKRRYKDEILDRFLKGSSSTKRYLLEENFTDIFSFEELTTLTRSNKGLLLVPEVAFPLLRRLVEAGDPLAKRRYKDEILDRFLKASKSTQVSLLEDEFMDIFSTGEIIRAMSSKKEARFLRDLEAALGKSVHIDSEDLDHPNSFVLQDGKISHLQISYAPNLQRIPDSVGSLKNAKKLVIILPDSPLEVLPETLGKMGALEEIIITAKKLKSLPDSIGELKNLKKLDVFSEEMEELPGSIVDLKQLKILSLWECKKLKRLPESIGNLSSLEVLEIERNPLGSLPESIGNLSSLEILKINQTSIESLPESIGNLSSLRELRVNGNYLEKCPGNLKFLPESIGNLSALEEASFGRNQLAEVPESVGNLKGLKSLSLSSNRLEVVPESLWDLENLESLYLDKNRLSIISENVLNLKKLQILSLEHNEIPTTSLKFLRSRDLELLLKRPNELGKFHLNFIIFKKIMRFYR